MSVAHRGVARAAAWSMGGSWTQYAVSFLLLVYLAHVLEPRDFGLIATVSVGLDLGARISRWGQVELLQQERYRSDQARNQSFRLSLAIGALFTILFLALAGPIGSAYHSVDLKLMMLICSPVFLLSAPGATAEALLRADFKFRTIAIRNSVTSLVGAAVALVLIRLGFGVVGIAIQRLIQAGLVSVWVWTAVDWRPRLLSRLAWNPQLFHEGTHVMLGTLMPLLLPRSIDLFVGAFIGTTQLGLMRVGARINDFVGQIVVMPLVSVANTHLSSLHDDITTMRGSYLRLTQASAALMCPALVGLSLVAPEAIPIIFGSKWVGAVPFVEITGLLGVVAPINYYFAPTMMALGRSRLVLKQGVIQVALGLMLAFAGAMISLLAVAIANVARGTLVAIWNLAELRKAMKLTLREVTTYLAAPYVGTLAMAAVVIALRFTLGSELGMLARLALLSSAGAVTYMAVAGGGDRIGLWPVHAGLRIPSSRSGVFAAE